MSANAQSNTRQNIVYQLIYQISSILLPLVTGPIVARALGASLLGSYNYSISIVNYFCICSSLGIATLGTREIGKCGENIDRRTNVFWNIYYIKLIISIGILTLYGVVFCSGLLKNIDKFLFLILIFQYLGSVFDISWLFFGVENFKVTVIKNIGIKLISLLFIVIFIRSKEDFYSYALIVSLSEFSCNVFLWYNARKYIKFSKFNWMKSKDYIKPMLILFIPAIASSLYVYLDKIILGIISESAEVGYYSSMESIINLPIAFITAITTVFYSRSVVLLSDKQEKSCIQLLNKTISMLFLIIFPCCIGLVCVSDTLVPVYFGSGYEPVSTMIKIGVLYVLFRTVRAVLKSQALLPREMDKQFICAILVGGASNIIIDIILIPLYGALGAVIGTIISDGLSTGLCIYWVHNYIDVKRTMLSIIRYGIIGISMAIVIILTGLVYSGNSMLIKLLLQIGSGIISYLTLTVCYFLVVTKGKLGDIFNHI